MTVAALRKENIELGPAHSFGRLVRYPHGGQHGGVPADMALEEEPRVLYPDQQTAGRE